MNIPSQPHALIVDDEPDICELLELTLGRMNIETRAATDLTQAKELLTKHRFEKELQFAAAFHRVVGGNMDKQPCLHTGQLRRLVEFVL